METNIKQLTDELAEALISYEEIKKQEVDIAERKMALKKKVQLARQALDNIVWDVIKK